MVLCHSSLSRLTGGDFKRHVDVSDILWTKQVLRSRLLSLPLAQGDATSPSILCPYPQSETRDTPPPAPPAPGPPSHPIVFRKMPSPIPALTCHLFSRPASPKGMKAFLDHHLNKRSRNQTRKSGPSLPPSGTHHQPRPAWAVDGAGSTQGRG